MSALRKSGYAFGLFAFALVLTFAIKPAAFAEEADSTALQPGDQAIIENVGEDQASLGGSGVAAATSVADIESNPVGVTDGNESTKDASASVGAAAGSQQPSSIGPAAGASGKGDAGNSKDNAAGKNANASANGMTAKGGAGSSAASAAKNLDSAKAASGQSQKAESNAAAAVKPAQQAASSAKAVNPRANLPLTDGGIYQIASAVNSGYVIDIAGGSKGDGANAQVYQSNNTLAQYFKAVWISGDWYYFVNLGSSKALDVSNGSKNSGANVWQYVSNSTAAQKWRVVKNSDGTFTIYSGTNQKLALDLSGANAGNGSNVQVYQANGTKAQRWYLRKNEALTSAVSQGSSVSNGFYTIVSALPGQDVLDVSGGSRSDSANIQLYGSNNTFAQKTKVNRVVSNLYTIEFANSGKVLDVCNGSTKSGANVQQFSSNSTLAQMWYFKKNASTGLYEIVSAGSGLVLNVAGGKAANGANVCIASSNGSAAQAFSLKSVQLVNNGTYVIQSSIVSPMVLDVAGGSKNSGANVQIYRSNGTDAQKFQIKYLGQGMYSIVNKKSGKFLDVSGASTANGANVQQYDGNGTKAQKWVIDEQGGALVFKSAVSGKVLDVSGGSRFSGGNVQQYGWNATAAQKFFLQDENWSFFSGASDSAMRYISKAGEYQGWPYVWGGRSPQMGFDCAGLVMYCANATLGKNYDLWYTNAESLLNNHCYQISQNEARAGDLVFFRGTYGNNINYISHVVIYCGNGIYYGAGDPIGYNWVSAVRNTRGQVAQTVYARMR